MTLTELVVDRILKELTKYRGIGNEIERVMEDEPVYEEMFDTLVIAVDEVFDEATIGEYR